MNRLDLIIDRLEHCKGLTQIDRMHLKKALAAARELKALAQSEPQVCCGDYEKCIKPCTPRGRWLANQQMTRLEQEKGQFVGGIPEVSQQREWVGLTDDEITKIMHRWRNGYIDIKDVEQLLKDKNT